MKKIVFVLDNYHFNLGGASLSAKAIITAYRRLGHDVTVLTLGKKQEFFKQEDGILVKAFLISSPWLKIKDSHLKTLVVTACWKPLVLQQLELLEPDVVFCQGMLTPATIEAAKHLKIPSRVFLHGYEGFSPHFFKDEDPLVSDPISFKTAPWKLKLKWPLVKKNLDLYRAAYLQADLLIANSRYMALLVEKYFQRPSQILYPIWDIKDRFEASLASVLPRDKPAACNLLFIKPQKIKGVERVRSLAALMPRAEFWIVGQPSKLIRNQLSALKNVRIMDAKEDLASLYQKADLLIGPVCFPEPYGRVFTEACFFGLPCVASKAGGIPESVGKGGLLLDLHASNQEWVNTIEEALTEEKYSSLSKQGVSFYSEITKLQRNEVLEDLL